MLRLVARLLGGRGVPLVLGSRFASRAPARTIPFALAVTLATGTLAFAAIERSSSEQARLDRASYVTGADVRVAAPPEAQRAGAVAERATLLSRNGRVLAQGPAGERSSPLVGIADSIAGSMEPEETREEREQLYAHGFPRDYPVGQSGLEEAFEDRLRGRPGGELIAGGRRVLARTAPRAARPERARASAALTEPTAAGLQRRSTG